MAQRQVLILQRRMVEYRLPLFELLRERLGANAVELRVAYGAAHPIETSRRDDIEITWGLRIPNHYIGIGSRWIVWQSLDADLLRVQDLVIVPHELRHGVAVRLLIRRGWPAKRVGVWGHGRNFQARQRNGLGEYLKRRLFQRADWWFAYTALSVAAYQEMGANPDRITCLNNTVDVDRLVSWRASLQREEIIQRSASLGFKGQHAGVFIGSLSQEKRLGFLFAAADELRSRISDFELLLVGDGPLRCQVEDFVCNRPWAVWVGSKRDREKMAHLAIGQLVLNPGMVGLGILDAFAAGTPLVTTDCGIHSPEIEYLQSGINGIMTSNCLEEYVCAVEQLLKNDLQREEMGRSGQAALTHLSLGAMVERFAGGILSALECPSRRTFGQTLSRGES